jgi:hypothetical protein
VAFIITFKVLSPKVMAALADSEVAQHFLSLLGADHRCSSSRRRPSRRPQGQPAAADAADIWQLQHRLGVLSTAKHAAFTAAQVAAACQLVERRKSVAGSLPPWFLKAATTELAAQFNAWVRVSQLPASVALSLVDPIPKPGAAAGSLDGLHGIAVGTMPAKPFAVLLKERVSGWAEASGVRAGLASGGSAAQLMRRWCCALCKTSTAQRGSSCGPALRNFARPMTACRGSSCGTSWWRAAWAAAGCERCKPSPLTSQWR